MDLTPNTTPPVVVETDSITFAVIGDYGKAGEPELNVSKMVDNWNPDFIITLGDNNYNEGELSTIKENISQYYCDYIYNPDAPEGYSCNGRANDEKLNRFFPAIGNHDYNSKDDIIPYLNFFSLPGEVFSVSAVVKVYRESQLAHCVTGFVCHGTEYRI